MIVAAIYARKSTEQPGVADAQKSVARQIENATAYALQKGWTVTDEYTYVDDGISGAEFTNRPGYMRLLNALKPRVPFQVLIVSELSRVGREQLETGYAVKQLAQAGVKIFSYLEDREILLETPTDKFLMSAVNFAAEIEREKARQRVADAMARKARAGHCCGGCVFGYDNLEIVDASGKRSHVERRINDVEATIVRRIFELCANGTGYTRIAKQLNAEGAPAPRPKRGRVSGWAPTSVKEILDRRLYLGEIIWNRTKKTDAWGQKRQRSRPETDWICRPAPELRIVSDEQWRIAHQRLTGIRAHLVAASGGRIGARRRDVDSHYLLPGFARCAVCGGGLGVMSGSHQSARGHVYGCLAYLKRGTSVCGNGLRLPIGRVDDAVLQTLGGDVLRPAVVMAVIDGVLAELSPHTLARDLDDQRAKVQEVEREISYLTKAIAAGGPLESLLTELKARERRRHELAAAIMAGEAVDLRRFDRKAIEGKVCGYVDRWRALLTDHVEDGRQLLREVLEGPIRFTPDGRAYRFEGEAAIGRLLAGVVGLPTNVVAVRGFEPRSRG
jgi:site-specific DNA recombinase